MHTKKKLNVYLAQVNYRYGDNVFLPYSVGVLQAYCQRNEIIKENFAFKSPFFLRENPVEIVKKLQDPDVIGVSCYIWNWEYNKILAQAVKARFPECLVVFGGTQAPVASEGFFVRHPYVDLIVHYEGELSFEAVLLERLSSHPDYTRIPGLSVKVENDQTFKTPARERIPDLSILASPYLEGVFDGLMTMSVLFQASQETNRGCPYSCSFCDWGGDVYDKVRPLNEEQLIEEFKWFGKHHVEYLLNCDANYGILPRDYDLTLKMIEARQQHGGFPKKFRASYAKNSNDKIFEIARLLKRTDMNKGVTLAFQSMDDHTLGIIKRKNIKIQNFRELMQRYRREDIATFTEVIMTLPGETYDSFKRGINTLIDAGQHDALNIYVCVILPNSEMNNPNYRMEHGLRSVHAPVLLAHSTPSADITEYNERIIATNTMPEKDSIKTFLFAWSVQSLHCLGLTQQLAVFMRRHFDFSYEDFYQEFLDYCQANPETLVGQEFLTIKEIVAKGSIGGRLDVLIPKFGDVLWPLEDASFLNFISQKARFYGEILVFLKFLRDKHRLGIPEGLLENMVVYCSAMMVDPFTDSDFSISLDYDFHNHFPTLYESEDAVALPQREHTVLTVKPKVFYKGDLPTYAREVVWYGRRGGKLRHTNIVVE